MRVAAELQLQLPHELATSVVVIVGFVYAAVLVPVSIQEQNSLRVVDPATRQVSYESCITSPAAPDIDCTKHLTCSPIPLV